MDAPTPRKLHPSTCLKRKADAMDISQPAATIPRKEELIELTPDADVTLKVTKGDAALDIKVSRFLLSLASRVFRSMLNSQFVEGSTRVIELKDEDPSTVLNFCYIIHHQCDSIVSVNDMQLRQLIVLADMRDCKEALKPWILSEMVDYLPWFKGNSSYTIPGSPLPTSLPGFVLEDFIAFAAVFGLDDLFFKATVAYFARGEFRIVPSDRNKLPGTTAPIGSHGTCIYDFLSDMRLKLVRELLQKAIKAVNADFGKSKPSKKGKPFTATTFCKSSQEKYGTFMSWLTLEGINAGEILLYPGSWWRAMNSIQSIATRPTSTSDPDGGPQGEDWMRQCHADSCKYCMPGIKKRLGELASQKTLELPGVCLKCFLTNGKDDCLRTAYCTKPGHSNQGGKVHSKAA